MNVLPIEAKRDGLLPLADLTLIPQFFTPKECHQLRQMVNDDNLVEQLLTRKRIQFDCDQLAKRFWDRLLPYFRYPTQMDKYGNTWKACGLNTHFRIGIYTPGDKFSRHEDGYYQPDVNTRSFATAMVYLNDVSVDNGGATYFTEHSFRIQPQEGLCCVFLVDDLLHCGEELKEGKKYLLRTDVMYHCDNMKQIDIQEEIFHLKEETCQLNDIESIPIWDRIFKLESMLSTN